MCAECLDNFKQNYEEAAGRPMAEVIAVVAVESDGDVTIIRRDHVPPDMARRLIHEAVDKADWSPAQTKHLASGLTPATPDYMPSAN